MEKIGQLSIGKVGFDVGFNHYVMRNYHGNFDLYVNTYTSDNNDYVATLRIIDEFKKGCNGLTLSEYCQERINSAEPNCT